MVLRGDASPPAVRGLVGLQLVLNTGGEVIDILLNDGIASGEVHLLIDTVVHAETEAQAGVCLCTRTRRDKAANEGVPRAGNIGCNAPAAKADPAEQIQLHSNGMI